MSTPSEVDAWLADCEHPQKPLIEALRRAILGADPSIAEGVKWNSPSFRTGEWFATLNLRGPRGASPVRLVLHLGAKRKLAEALAIEDPSGLLEWLGKERAVVAFVDAADLRRKRDALQRLVRSWIGHV